MKFLVQNTFETTALTLFSAVFFVCFFTLNNWVFSYFEYSEGISWVFLPAGFRIILILVLGLPAALGLMLGSWFIDRALFNDQTAVLAILNGVVGGFTPWLVMKYMNQRQWLSHELHALTAPQLLNLTLIFSAASAVTHQLVWVLLERPRLNIWVDIWPMFFGDVLGTLLMLYAFKFVLDRTLKTAQGLR